MTSNIILFVLLLLTAFALYRSYARREGERGAHREYCEQLLQEIEHYKARTSAIQNALETTGGIGKRIAECREIAAALQQHAPEVFKNEPGLIYWIEATDQFLVELHAATGSNPAQERMANSRSGQVYNHVRTAAGLSFRPGSLAHAS